MVLVILTTFFSYGVSWHDNDVVVMIVIDKASPFRPFKNVCFSGRRPTSTTVQPSRRTWPFKIASGTPSVEQHGSAFTMEEGLDGGRSVDDDDGDDDQDDND